MKKIELSLYNLGELLQYGHASAYYTNEDDVLVEVELTLDKEDLSKRSY